ncbi:hypothetical protein Q6348_08005 [Isoptericola sp. b441]|uniref:Helix-turn-helix domain-containing protein n=1 Tax=Actinotalea lenta TaxID=3064654 RepID=A0ABT9DAH4_9CELL|nr:hypothetical protein [Isoptericola sp. b441]MDO8107138.1 hypothetical protein [Isoptericola sp. b441]
MPGGFRVRVSRRHEARQSVVARAIPEGSSRAPSQRAFLEAVAACGALDELRADGRATVLEVARHLAWWADWDTITSRPTWAVLCERTGRSRATVARALARLRAVGLVGVVATGRSAAYQPAARDAGVAEAAVYVLCVPSPLAAVDEDETPTGLPAVSGTHPPRARESEPPSEPLRGRLSAPAARGAGLERVDGPVGRPAGGDRPGLRRKDDRMAAALALSRAVRARTPALRGISERYVAWVVRDFADAGWSAGELLAAIDRRPDGRPWPYDGATGIDPHNLAAWLTWRLSAWRDKTGAPMASPGQVAAAEARERLAAQLAERARRDAAAAERNAAGAVRDALGPGHLEARRVLDELARARSRRPRGTWRAP